LGIIKSSGLNILDLRVCVTSFVLWMPGVGRRGLVRGWRVKTDWEMKNRRSASLLRDRMYCVQQRVGCGGRGRVSYKLCYRLVRKIVRSRNSAVESGDVMMRAKSYSTCDSLLLPFIRVRIRRKTPRKRNLIYDT